MLWTQTEKDSLLGLLDSYPSKKVAHMLGRSVSSIRYQRKILERVSKKPTPQDKYDALTAELPVLDWIRQRGLGQKFCPTCRSWRALRAFEGNCQTKDKLMVSCKTCTPPKAVWSQAERGKLFKFLGTYTAAEIAEFLGRSAGSVQKYCGRHKLSLRLDSNEQFTFGKLQDVLKINNTTLLDWVRLGLVARKKHCGYGIIRRADLLRFLKARPEALEVYALSSETLETLGICLEIWPEPPNFKYLKCRGFLNATYGVKVRHATTWVALSLFTKNKACPVCHRSLKHWAIRYGDIWGKAVYTRSKAPPGSRESPQHTERNESNG